MPYAHRTPSSLIATLVVAASLTACGTANAPAPPGSAPPIGTAPAPGQPASPRPPVVTATPQPVAPAPAAEAAGPPPASAARTPLAYRRDAATHLYAQNAERIYKGMLKPNLYAVGVLEVDIDRRGQITAINWRRAPSHVPDVMAEIIRTVRAAAPYPVPARMGKVTYTDIWLWDKSGKFQLDTLTEGQL